MFITKGPYFRGATDTGSIYNSPTCEMTIAASRPVKIGLTLHCQGQLMSETNKQTDIRCHSPKLNSESTLIKKHLKKKLDE